VSGRAACCGVDGAALLVELHRCAAALARAEEFTQPRVLLDRVVLDRDRSC
jgi:hypothetical protein